MDIDGEGENPMTFKNFHLLSYNFHILYKKILLIAAPFKKEV